MEVAINISFFNISSNCDKNICLFYIISLSFSSLVYLWKIVSRLFFFLHLSWSFSLRLFEWPWWFTCQRINPFYKHFLDSDRAWYLRCLSYRIRMYRWFVILVILSQCTCANWANTKKVVIIFNPALTCIG